MLTRCRLLLLLGIYRVCLCSDEGRFSIRAPMPNRAYNALGVLFFVFFARIRALHLSFPYSFKFEKHK